MWGENVEFFNFKLGGTHSDTFSFKYVIELLNYYYFYYLLNYSVYAIGICYRIQ
jgi:hypothetical protein